MAYNTGEIRNTDGGLEIVDTHSTVKRATFFDKVEYAPLGLTGPGSSKRYFSAKIQATCQATVVADSYAGADSGLGFWTGADSAITLTGAFSGTWHDYTDLFYAGMGAYLTTPAYSGEAPLVASGYVYAQETGSVGGTNEVMAIDIEQVIASTTGKDDLDFEVACMDDTAWTCMGANQPCSAYAMKYLVCGNTNRMAAKTLSARTIPL